VKYGRDYDLIQLPIDFIDHDVGKSRDNPFEGLGIAPDMPQSRKRDRLRSGMTILGDPIENVLEISNGLIIEDKLHALLRAKPMDASSGLVMRQKLAVGIEPPSADLGHLRIGQLHIPHVLDVFQQRTGRCVLLGGRQFLDFAQSFFEQLCHRITIAHDGRQNPPAAVTECHETSLALCLICRFNGGLSWGISS
jgi:hypothetical protein